MGSPGITAGSALALGLDEVPTDPSHFSYSCTSTVLITEISQIVLCGLWDNCG